MQSKIPKSMLIFSLLAIILLVFQLSLAKSHVNPSSYSIQQNGLPVQNVNTGKSYSTIQAAINAPETLNGHEIFVSSGIYDEQVTVNKSLSLVGQNRDGTIIDGNRKSKVVYVTVDNVEIRDFTIRNGTFGLWLDYSDNTRIIGNTLQYGSYGIRLLHSKNTQLIENNVREFDFFGVELDSSGNSTLRSNSLENNKYNFGVDGNSMDDFINDIDTSNTVNGKPIRYFINQHDVTADASSLEETGYLGFVNSTNIKMHNLDVQDNIQGVLFAYAKNSTVTNVNARNNWNGIYVTHSSNISANENKANGNFDYGIKFFNSSQSIASGNNVDNNGWAGIGLFRSPNSTLDRNEANFNTYNLHIVYTNNSVITRNNATSRPGKYSIAMYYSHYNVIYHNTFDTSLLYVETRNRTRFTPRNSWDNGLDGNYWSTYRGVDADQDGLGDTPYIVGEDNIDNHPLMGQFTDYTVGLNGRIYSVNVISNSTISEFNFNLNQKSINYRATGANGTQGFSRLVVPNALLQEINGDDLTVQINGEQVTPKRKWADAAFTYFYFSFANALPETGVSPWLITFIAVISFVLLGSALGFLIFKKKRETLSMKKPS